MKMQMLPDARACGLALIETYIDALAVEVLLEYHRAALDQIHDFVGFLGGQIGKSHNVPVRTDHDMPVVIGIFLHDHKSPRAAIEHQPLLVFVRGIGQTKNTGIGLGSEDVFNAPRRPKLFHDQTSIHCMGGGSKR